MVSGPLSPSRASANATPYEQKAIRHGICQMMILLPPFLRDAERLQLDTLSQAYVSP